VGKNGHTPCEQSQEIVVRAVEIISIYSKNYYSKTSCL